MSVNNIDVECNKMLDAICGLLSPLQKDNINTKSVGESIFQTLLGLKYPHLHLRKCARIYNYLGLIGDTFMS